MCPSHFEGEQMEVIQNLLSNLLENKEGYLLVLTSAVTLAAAITALTPSPKDDGWVKTLRNLLDKLALNVRNAKNKEE